MSGAGRWQAVPSTPGPAAVKALSGACWAKGWTAATTAAVPAVGADVARAMAPNDARREDLRMGTSFGDSDTASPLDFAAALRAGLGGVVARGKAEPGDKTMYDALAPAVDALDSALGDQSQLATALKAARDAAAAGRDATTPMLARKGRASYLGERSVGHQDPGATTVALLLEAATESPF